MTKWINDVNGKDKRQYQEEQFSQIADFKSKESSAKGHEASWLSIHEITPITSNIVKNILIVFFSCS